MFLKMEREGSSQVLILCTIDKYFFAFPSFVNFCLNKKIYIYICANKTQNHIYLLLYYTDIHYIVRDLP